MNKQPGDLKQNTIFNSISLGDPKKLSTSELEQIVFNNLKSAGEKLQNSSSPIRTIKQVNNQQEQGNANLQSNLVQQNQRGMYGNYTSIQPELQQKTLPINRNTPSFSNVIINDSLVGGQDNTENAINHNQVQLNAFASPSFNSPSQKLLFSNTNRGETMTRRELENSNQVPQEKRENPQLINNLPPHNNPFQTTDQLTQVQNILSSIENPFSQNLFASHFKGNNNNNNSNQNSGSILPTLGNSGVQKYQLLPPKQLETPNKSSLSGLGGNQFKQEFQRNVSEQNMRNPRHASSTSNKENNGINSQSSTTTNAASTNQIGGLFGDQVSNNTMAQSNALSNSNSVSNQKLRSVSPTFNGWSDSTSPAIAGAMKVLKDKYTKAEQQLKELQQTCEEQQREINQLRESERTSKQQWEENQKESFLKLSEQTGKVLGEITKLQTENAHVQNENTIMQKQIDAYKDQIQELTQEVLYLRKCNDIIEGEKTKHLEHNAQERDEQDQKFIIMEKLRKADKQLIEKLENDLQQIQNIKRVQEEKLKKIEIENEQLKNELYDSQETLEGRCRGAESKLSLYEKELNLIKEKYEKERNFNQKRASIYAEKDQRMKQMQEENIDLRSQVKSQQAQIDHNKKSNDLHEKLKQKSEREKYSQEESYKQLKGITEEIISLAQREGNARMKEQIHLIQQRVKRLDDGVKKTSESMSSISQSGTKSKLTKSRGPSQEKKGKESTVSRANNFSASKTKSSVTSSSANKFYKQASPRSNKIEKNHSSVTVVSNKKLKSKSKSRNPSHNKALHLEDLDESIESRRSALAGSSSVSKLNNQGQKRMSRKNSLVLSQNNSLDFDTMSPHTGRKSNIGQTNRSTSRQRSVSKNSDYSSKNKSQQKRKQNLSQISQNSYIYHEDRGNGNNDEDDIDVLMTNQSQVTVKPNHQNSSNANRYGNQGSQSQNVLTEPKNPSSYVQSYQFPENFEKMAETEISNEIFKLERAVAETRREYNNLLAKSREKSDINIEEMRSRMNELAIDMQKQSDWQFVLKKRQREIITMSFGKTSQQNNQMN